MKIYVKEHISQPFSIYKKTLKLNKRQEMKGKKNSYRRFYLSVRKSKIFM